MHAWVLRPLRGIWLPNDGLAPIALDGRYFLLAAAAVLVLVAGLSGWPGADRAANPYLQQTLARVLTDSSGTSGRLVGAHVTPWDDLSIEFTVRDDADIPANRAAAMADALAVVRAVYEWPEARPLNVTVLGLAPSTSSVANPVPVLYASLSADRLVGLDWTTLEPDDLSALGGVRWLPNGVCQAWRDCAAVGH
jgi:hypothetical protein